MTTIRLGRKLNLQMHYHGLVMGRSLRVQMMLCFGMGNYYWYKGNCWNRVAISKCRNLWKRIV